MRIQRATDNGNVVSENRQSILLHNNSENTRSWVSSSDSEDCRYTNKDDNQTFNTNFNIYEFKQTSGTIDNRARNNSCNERSDINDELVICNRQYMLNNQKLNLTVNSKNPTKLGKYRDIDTDPCDNGLVDVDESANTTPVDEERTFDQSDTDEMSENGSQHLPRGIVNPNYPGFQHLAHTLQDYSSNIENFYHSENEMTDDDVDADITETTIELEQNQDDHLNIANNNNNRSECSKTSLLHESFQITNTRTEVPDLLKTISSNNNNGDSISYDLTCSTIDIENNFNTKDIIGDFNKEIEDEIKQLLNYNINIQDDLEELRHDIKETFAKPIENTINNISDVVNHVIKKLVETQSDMCDDIENKPLDNEVNKDKVEDVTDIHMENETNTRTEINMSRPTFLLIESHTNNKITDAFLSDGKEEINIYQKEYDTETLSHNVENTIKQLSTELRKIIPKLNEMRERDKLWADSKKEVSIITDGNFNNISPSSIKFNNIVAGETTLEVLQNETSQRRCSIERDIKKSTSRRYPEKLKSDASDWQTTSQTNKNAQMNTSSVHLKNDNMKEYDFGSFDVYNIETALPKLDLDAIENHLKAAKEAERRKRNDREEIRKRLANDADNDEYFSLGHMERPGKKPSLHSRLQNGMNLQICFMNETASDNESQASDLERNLNSNNKSLSRSSLFSKSHYNHPYHTRPLSVNITKHEKKTPVQSGSKIRPSSFSLKTTKSRSTHSLGHIELKESDFYALQATLQTEARIALAQAKEMARIQMERERRSRAVSPVTEMLRQSMDKANVPLAPDRRRVSRQLLTDMNIAQLQVIVNELHSQIEALNDSLVKLLMARDELHMGQDSMLVDIEDLTRYLGVKEQTKKTKGTTTKSGVRRLTSLVQK